jgi:hypothetical protein
VRVLSSEEHGNKKDFAGEDLQQFTGSEPAISIFCGLISSRFFRIVITDYKAVKSTQLQ